MSEAEAIKWVRHFSPGKLKTENVKKVTGHPYAWFYSSPYMTLFIVFDEDGRATDYVVGGQ